MFQTQAVQEMFQTQAVNLNTFYKI
jgi:hypothetical protein